mgnify:CR=1 FL=1
MGSVQALFLTVILPILALGLHEMTHLVAARIISPVSVECASYVPFRLRLDFQETPSLAKLRIVAFAPVFVGGIAAIVALRSGLWQQLRHTDPYYLYFLTGINWLLYIFPSTADFRLALTSTESRGDRGAI